jgi:hypothetical protein
VPEFLVESYVARADGATVRRGAVRAGKAAQRLTREGVSVRLLRSIFVPEDETCFYLYEASSEDAVRKAVRRAELTFDRISEAHTQSSVSRVRGPSLP